MPDNFRNREWLEAEERESSTPGLPRADLNPLVNPLLAQNMGRWAQVYFTTPAEHREQAVEKLLEELKAESNGQKPAAPTTNAKPDHEASVPESEKEPELPIESPGKADLEIPELPIQSPAKGDALPGPTGDAEDLVTCPGCHHKNAAEQRFCGICGIALGQEVTPEKSDPVSDLAAPGITHAEDPESDWRWLRERSFSSYQVNTETKSRSRVWVAVMLLLAISAGGYLLWRNRTRPAHEQLPNASSLPASSAPAQDMPTATPQALSTSRQLPTKIAEKNITSAQVAEAATQQKASNVEPSSELASDDGRAEVDRAHQYLAGAGVPKNSWMASQLLWKAVAKQNSEAVLLLSDLYAHGDGVPRSCEQARVLLVSAAKKGSSAAAQKLRSVETGCR
ncbi:MAG TPA: hypothetical protein VMT53_08430 [Terriglobales bacterium]|nr:hypothetical protein [Terriglobales bacterium]